MRWRSPDELNGSSTRAALQFAFVTSAVTLRVNYGVYDTYVFRHSSEEAAAVRALGLGLGSSALLVS